MKASIRKQVRERAERRCEYSRLHERDLRAFPFHLEHIIAKKHAGSDDPSNLCWACHFCNLGKSSNLSGRDSVTGKIVVLFNPRRQRWRRHFRWRGPRLIGKTECGRATIAVLNINKDRRIALRAALIAVRRFPPRAT